MKKFVMFLMVVMMLVALVACGEKTMENNPQVEPTLSTEPETTESVEPTESNAPAESANPVESNEPTESTNPVESSNPVESTEPTETAHTHDWTPVYTTVHHDAEYKTVHHDAVTHVVHHDAEYKTVHHDAEYKEEQTLVGYEVTNDCATFKDGHFIDPYDYNYNGAAYNQACMDYQKYCSSNGINSAFSNAHSETHIISVETYNAYKGIFYNVKPQYDTVRTLVKDAYDETVLVRAAYDETVVDKAAYDEKVLVRDAYDEQVVDYYVCECGERK